MKEARIPIGGVDERLLLFGYEDRNLRAIERETGVTISAEGDELVVSGAPKSVADAQAALHAMVGEAATGRGIAEHDVALILESVRPSSGQRREASRALPSALATTRRGQPVLPRTAGQRAFVEAIARHTLTLAVGPAGTGKTFLAVVMALAALRSGEVQRLILSRPAVEAGENLGFLPGDLQQKVDPYLRPLFDALGEIMDQQAIARAIERGQIEVAPLAYMRGRTLSDAFIVLDEGQNTKREQMKMFLTRIGAHSKMVVCGDVTQVDLVRPQDSGLVHAARIFDGIEDVAIVTLGIADVVRHSLIGRILGAYDHADQ